MHTPDSRKTEQPGYRYQSQDYEFEKAQRILQAQAPRNLGSVDVTNECQTTKRCEAGAEPRRLERERV